jgi:hypothetical protein
MIFHPSVLALYVSSVLIAFMVLYAASYGVQILRRWDIGSGSETQLILERKTYLISTLLTYLLGFELLSLFLYVFTADHLHTFFVGAMCAAGTLYVNGYGYPTLILKIVNFLLAGLWLILNYTDNRGYDYPLIRKKYLLLLIMTPLLLAEGILQANYFLRMKPNIITSCCGSLFSAGENGFTSEILAFPTIPMEVAFYLSVTLTVASGVYFYRKGRGAYLFSSMSVITLLVSLASILSFISLYFYEQPTHHCPFCILQREYGYIGYPLYMMLFGGGILGMGTGALMPFRETRSLSGVVPSLQKRLALISMILLLLFTAIVTFRMVFSNFVLKGY